MFTIENLLLGIILSTILAILAIKKKLLTKDGVIAAFIIGVITMAFGGKTWFLLLVTFLFTSSFVTKYKKNIKNKLVAEKFEKGGTRDAFQVVANGLIPMLLAITENFITSDIFFAAFIGAVATVTADTWGTEIGILSKSSPRLITTLKKVEPGTSGGITKIGTFASILGALIVGLVALIARGLWITVTTGYFVFNKLTWLVIVALLSGFLGCIMDSFLGATVQAMFYCDHCMKETEKRIHSCGNKTRHIRGIKWLNNDMVNLLSSLFGAAVGALLFIYL
ncbi:MAG: DUF92 domain-containing protein [Candidatus Odinarchaeota archaeon]|nr:DUF92 domain-containing protein [Candidatus Odinarchaeota archaeon]